MIKAILTIFLFIGNTLVLFGCTTFVLKNDSTLLFGRNLDWVSDDGVIVVNKRNVHKESLVFPPNRSAVWTSRYGSITFNQFGKEFPFGGINEKGLVVEIMRTSGTYPAYDQRASVNELQWVQYQLDNAQTVKEVIASDREIRISKVDQILHFLVCDAEGNVAVIEFGKRGMYVYTGDQLPTPVLENDGYAVSLERLKRKEKCRFTTVVNKLSNYKGESPAVDYSFEILDKVALDGSWSIVYDIHKKEIHFKTASHRVVRSLKVHDFDLDCKISSQLYDLTRQDTGAVNERFEMYTAESNKKKFDAAVKSNNIQLPRQILSRFRRYNETCECLLK